MSNAKGMGHSEPTSIHIAFLPGARECIASVKVSKGLGKTYRSRPVWRGRLDLGLMDLAGLTSGQCAVVLCDHLRWRLSYGADVPFGDSDPLARLRAEREASGAPLGATGGTVTQYSLPGI